MFIVLFEVQPKDGRENAYLGYAKLLRLELEKVEGFVDNIRYRSLTRAGWVLSLSSWVNEKALVRWRTQAVHHEVQEKGRFEVFHDYHLRVGQATLDTRLPEGCSLTEQRLDETEVGEGTAVTLIDGSMDPEWVKSANPEEAAKAMGLDSRASGLIAWDVCEAVLTPGDVVLLLTWRDQKAAEAFEATVSPGSEKRMRRVRVIRDYSLSDRREAPQYYPEVQRS